MNRDSGRNLSHWMATAAIPPRPPLEGAVRTDVLVVGAGIAGLTTAYYLAAEGRRVLVADDGPIGGGQTERTTAHLSTAIDDRYVEIERLHGREGARLAAQSHSTAIDQIEILAKEERIDCGFRRVDGWLFQPPGGDPVELERERDAALRAGLHDVDMVPRAPLPSFDTGPCLRFPLQGQVHPLRYLAGLAQGIERRGGRIANGTRVVELDSGPPARARTDRGATVLADVLVVATNSPINDHVAIHTKQAPYLTFVIALALPRGSVPPGLYWDTLDPYHYVRTSEGERPDQDVLIVGGEDHKTGQAADAPERYARLQAWAAERFPMAGPVLERWSGQVMETVDGLGFIGRNPGDGPHVLVATGDSGMGMTHGTIAGMLLADLAQGRDNPWARLYDPSRKPLKAGVEWAKENLNVAAQYAGWLGSSDAPSAAAIPADSGAVVRRGLSRVAVYRDPEGILHERSASCTHLGCVVTWNDDEKTWDCPCHGSRYDPLGRPIQGPAYRPLGRAD